MHQGNLKPAWFILAVLFAASILLSAFTIWQSAARIGTDKPILPWWLQPLSVISEAGLFLSSAGLLILVVITILRAARNK